MFLERVGEQEGEDEVEAVRVLDFVAMGVNDKERWRHG